MSRPSPHDPSAAGSDLHGVAATSSSPAAEGQSEVDPEASGQDSIAPRPRPGFRSRSVEPATDRAQLFAGVLRASLGVVGFGGALLYLPVQQATPVLAGVSILMMVTGTTSTWRAVRAVPALRRLPTFVGGACAVGVGIAVVLTWVLGAGSLGPVAAARTQAARPDGAGAPAVRFEAGP